MQYTPGAGKTADRIDYLLHGAAGMENLVAGHGKGPGREIAGAIKLAEFLPQHHGHLLQRVLGPVVFAHMGEDEAPQARLRVGRHGGRPSESAYWRAPTPHA